MKAGEFLEKRREQGLLRTLKPVESPVNGRIIVEGREYVDFSSNDYLGLSGHPAIKAAALAAMEKYGTSSSASRLLTGDLRIHHELEERVAIFKGKEAALLFNSGYQANVGIAAALYGKDDAIFMDRLCHASLIDGAALSGAKVFRFRHNDAQHLAALLEVNRLKFSEALVVTESVFSMDGDVAPLPELVEVKQRFNCQMLVDEAHATGIFGPGGAGLVEAGGLTPQVEIIMGTFGKALGGFGAYVAASHEIIATLVNACRSFIYTTALPPMVVAGNIAAIELVCADPGRGAQLLGLSGEFRKLLEQGGLPVRGSSQIVPVVLGDAARTVRASEMLKDAGFWVAPIRPPTVPEGESRLRFSLTSRMDQGQIVQVARAAVNAGK